MHESKESEAETARPGGHEGRQQERSRTMKFIINETGKHEELSIIDTKTGMDWSNDLIGNSGAVGQYIEYDDVEDAYRINQEDFDWWSEYIAMYERYQEELDSLKAQYGSDAVDDIISRSDLWLGNDYNEHERELQAQIDAIREELG